MQTRSSHQGKSKGRTGPKFVNPTVKERVLADVARLRGFRYTQHEIAAKLGVSQAMVSNYEKELRRRYAETQFDETASLVAEKVAQYDEVIKQAAEAFEQSKTKTLVDDEGNEEVRDTTPEAVFLAKVMDALKAQRELLGLDAPTKSDVRQAAVNVTVGAARGAPTLPDGTVDWDAIAGWDESDPVEQAALPEHKGK